MKVFLRDIVSFNRCVKREMAEGSVETIENKGTPDIYYLVRTRDGDLLRVYPKEIMSSLTPLRSKKTSKPKAKNCGCK